MGVAPLDAARAGDPQHSRHEWGPFAVMPLPAHVGVAGGVAYVYDADSVEFTGGRFATGKTHVTFDGRTAWGGESACQ